MTFNEKVKQNVKTQNFTVKTFLKRISRHPKAIKMYYNIVLQNYGKLKFSIFLWVFHCFDFHDQWLPTIWWVWKISEWKKKCAQVSEELKQNHQKSCQNPLVWHKKRSPKFWFGRKFSQTRDFQDFSLEINTNFHENGGLSQNFVKTIPKISSLRKFSVKPKLSAALFMLN